MSRKHTAQSGKSARKQRAAAETDAAYFLKLVLYTLVGSFWLRLGIGTNELPIPLGGLIGLGFAQHEHLQIDRKIEYALLLMAMFLGYWFVPGMLVAL